MNSRLLICLIVLPFVVSVSSAPLCAQVRGVSDSTVVAQLAPGLFHALEHVIAKASKDGRTQAVRLELPDTPAWSKVARYTMRVINGRALTDSDTSELVASISDIAFKGDTLSATVHVGSRWRCRDGSWRGGFTEYLVSTVRRGDAWDSLRTGLMVSGDDVGCSPMGKPEDGVAVLSHN